MEKYLKIDKIFDISDDKWILLFEEIKKGLFIIYLIDIVYGLGVIVINE